MHVSYLFAPFVVVYQVTIHVPPAPSAAPTPMSLGSTTSNITVQWGAVDCIDHNGDITGYSVRYGVQGTAEGDRTVKMATGDSSGGMYTIPGLNSSTTYSIQVAAVNSAGIGVYCDPPVIIETLPSKYTSVLCV